MIAPRLCVAALMAAVPTATAWSQPQKPKPADPAEAKPADPAEAKPADPAEAKSAEPAVTEHKVLPSATDGRIDTFTDPGQEHHAFLAPVVPPKR
jgi:hypothetical protein